MNNPISEKPIEVRKLIDVAYLVLAAFAWVKEFLLPLVLAILISFLLAPVVSRLERWHFPRAVAVLSVVATAFALIGGLCSTLSLQGLDLVNSLPKYSDNIHAKWVAIQKGPPGPLNLAFTNVGLMIADLGKVSTSAGGAQKLEATKVEVVGATDSMFALVKNSLTPVMGPVAEFAVGLHNNLPVPPVFVEAVDVKRAQKDIQRLVDVLQRHAERRRFEPIDIHEQLRRVRSEYRVDANQPGNLLQLLHQIIRLRLQRRQSEIASVFDHDFEPAGHANPRHW